MLQPIQAGLWLLQGLLPAAGSNVSRLAGARPAWDDADAPTLPLSRPIQSAQQQDQQASTAAPAASGTAPAAGVQGADSEETRPLSRPLIHTRCAGLGVLACWSCSSCWGRQQKDQAPEQGAGLHRVDACAFICRATWLTTFRFCCSRCWRGAGHRHLSRPPCTR